MKFLLNYLFFFPLLSYPVFPFVYFHLALFPTNLIVLLVALKILLLRVLKNWLINYGGSSDNRTSVTNGLFILNDESCRYG
jgi:hypothetical protein